MTIASTTTKQPSVNPSRALQTHTLAERPLREWPAQERPTERLYSVGRSNLSDVELLALIIGSNAKPNPVIVAQAVLQEVHTIAGLSRLSVEEIAAISGVSRDVAARIAASLELGRRLLLATPDDRMQIRSPTDAAQLLMIEMSHLDQEQLRVLCLDTKNRVQKVHTVYIGSLNSSMVRVGEVFKEAIRINSASIIICHNHPSGEPTPSPEDVLVTRQIIEAGKLLDIDVLDHLVIGQGRYTSMRERGLGFAK